jgi:hypothetical protein
MEREWNGKRTRTQEEERELHEHIKSKEPEINKC